MLNRRVIRTPRHITAPKAAFLSGSGTLSLAKTKESVPGVLQPAGLHRPGAVAHHRPLLGEKKKAPRPWLRDERQPSAVPPRFGAVRRTPAGFNGPNPPVIGRTLQGEQSARFAGGFQPVASVLCCA